MKRFRKFITLVSLILLCFNAAWGQDMNNYITFKVKPGDTISYITLAAKAANTPVLIVGGQNQYSSTISAGNRSFNKIVSTDTILRIYGNINYIYTPSGYVILDFNLQNSQVTQVFLNNQYNMKSVNIVNNPYLTYLSVGSGGYTGIETVTLNNLSNLKTLNLSYNSISTLDLSTCHEKLEALFLHNNYNLTSLILPDTNFAPNLKDITTYASNLSTADIDNLICKLPVRTINAKGKITVVNNTTSYYDNFYNANFSTAKAKNWNVVFYSGQEFNSIGTYECDGVNLYQYATLRVEKGKDISFVARNNDKDIYIYAVSGNETYNTLVPKGNGAWRTIKAGDTILTIYGEVQTFCLYHSNNNQYIYSVDVSNFKNLKTLYINDLSKLTDVTLGNLPDLNYVNCANDISLSAITYDKIMCALPTCPANSKGSFYPIGSIGNTDYNEFIKTNSNIAKNKNWTVRTYTGAIDIPATTGNHNCANLDRYISLDVIRGERINLSFDVVAVGTPIRVISGAFDTVFTANNIGMAINIVPRSDNITIYGDIVSFTCSDNQQKLYGLDITHNTELTSLFCFNNEIASLDVSKATKLKYLYCYKNAFTTEELNKIVCAFPDNNVTSDKRFVPIYSNTPSDPDYYTVLNMSTVDLNAKKWRIVAATAINSNIKTNGQEPCSFISDNYAKITVAKDSMVTVNLGYIANGKKEWVRIICGDMDTLVRPAGYGYTTMSGTYSSTYRIPATDTIVTIYGDFRVFALENQNGIKDIEIKSVDLERLNLRELGLTQIDLAKCQNLKYLNLKNNKIVKLDITNQINLTDLEIDGNGIADIKLPPSNRSQLVTIWMAGNRFNSASWDMFFCALPSRSASNNATIYAYNTNEDVAAIRSCCFTLGTNKNWTYKYSNGNNIPLLASPIYTVTCNDMQLYSKVDFSSCVEIRTKRPYDPTGYFSWRIQKGENTQYPDIVIQWGGHRNIVGQNSPTLNVYIGESGITWPAGSDSVFYFYGNIKKLDVYFRYIDSIKVYSNSSLEEIYVCNDREVEGEQQYSGTDFYPQWEPCYVNIIQCENLHTINLGDMLNIYNAQIENCPKLKRLNLGKHWLANLDLSKGLPALEELTCNSYGFNKLPNVTTIQTSDKYYASYGGKTFYTANIRQQYLSATKTYLNINNCPNLRYLIADENKYTTVGFDSIMCALPQRPTNNKGTIKLVSTSDDSTRFRNTNASIATAKNWNWSGKAVTTVGTFNCEYPVMDYYIGIKTKKDVVLPFYRINVNAGRAVLIKDGNFDTTIVVSNGDEITSFNYKTKTDSITVFGDIRRFYISNTNANITGLDANLMPYMVHLDLNNANVTYLNIYNCSNLEWLRVNDHRLKTIDLRKMGKLRTVYLSGSSSAATRTLTSAFISNCPVLDCIYLDSNNLTTLDVSGCDSLRLLYARNNKFSTEEINNIFCQIPERIGRSQGMCFLYTLTSSTYNSSFPFYNTNISIAQSKNWGTGPYNGNGTFMCGQEKVNMNKYITLQGIRADSILNLDLRADSNNTPVLIVNGQKSIYQIVNKQWKNQVGTYQLIMSSDSANNTIIIYGDINAVNCSGNTSITKVLLANNPDLQVFNCSGTSIKSLNVSQNPKLMDIGIADCPFTTQSYNDMMCGICPKPANQAYAYIRPFRTNTNTTLDPCYQRFVEANVMNAMSKGWSVATIDEGVQPNFTSGIPYPCPVLDTTTSVSLTVTQGKWIKLDFSADSAFTVVSVVSGGYDTTFTLVNPNQSTPLYFYADATTMTIYGKIATLDCSNNSTFITGLNVSKNTRLTSLNCGRNKLTSLTLGNNAKLTYLNCYTNDLTSLNISNLPNLDSLYCSINKLTSLDISNNTKLKLCNAMENQIATLTVGQNTALEQLYCYSNKLTTLDVSTLTSLVNLKCHANELKTLDVSKNLALEELICTRNKITTLNLGTNTVLKNLSCVNNRLQSLSVTLNTALCTLMCDSNYLLDLDISRNTALKYISCGNNLFTTESYNQMMCNIVSVPGSENCRFLPVYNTTTTNADYKAFMAANANIAKNKGWKVGFGNSINTNITTTGTYTCPTVNTSSYIQMDVAQGETIKFKLMAPSSIQVRVISGALDTFVFATTGWSKVINITAGAPNIQIYGDVNGLDCGGNYENISDINVSHNRSICTLYCDRNNLTSLDVSNCLSLTDLYCFQNKIHDLNLANTPALKRLRCNDDSLTGLDLSSCFSLEYLDCYSNKLSYLDISSCPNLKELRCANNKLQSLDLTEAQALTSLDCEYNELTSLDVNTCASLEQLICRNNHIATLNVSLCTTLVDLDCSNNALTELDMNGCSSLNALSCQQNQLKSINVNNSKSINYLVCFENRFSTVDFDNLMCGLPMMSKGSGNFYPLKDNKDADSSIFHLANSNIAKVKKWNVNYFNSQTAISETEGTYICPQIAPETEVILYVKQGESVKLRMGASLPNSLIRVTSGGIDNLVTADTTFTDFQTFIADDAIVTITGLLSALDCSNNGDKITGIEIKNAHSLRYLDCSHNAISSLDLSPDATGKRSLKYLDCSFNKIASLIFYNDTLLETLLCNNNEIKDIFIDNNKYLQVINCSFNSIPSLTIKKFNFLRELYCNDNNLTLLNINSNIALETLHCFNNKLKSLNCNNNVALTDVRVYGNLFTFSKFNDIMCSLPTIVGTQATFVPLYNPSDMLAYVFGSANSNIATEKSWNVIYNDNTTIPFTTGDYICPFVNNSNVMTLKTKQGRQINLKLLADTAETYVRVSCGSLDTTFAINDTWSDAMPFYAADDDILYIYGDASGLDCSENGANISNIEVFNNANLKHLNCAKNSLTRLNVSKNKLLETLICNDNILKALDVRANTQLRTLTCYSNYFTSQAYNELMCSMPIITVGKGNFYPMYNSNNDTAFMSSNSTIASGKLWNVLYSNNTPIASTNGTYACPVIDTTSIIALNVQKNQEIKFKLNASTNNSAVNVVSGSLDTIVYVGLNSTGVISYISDADTMHIYGDVQSFDCNSNNTNILGLTVVNNATLENLVCNDNSISSLDLSTATSLVNLTCNNNNILSLDVSQSPALNTLICNNNSIATLDLTQNTSLEYLNANANRLTSLNIDYLSDLKSLHCEENNLVGFNLSTNTSLEELFCSKNNLNDLDLSQNVNLQEVYCQFNTLNTLTTGGAESLTILHCYNNLLTSLDLSTNTNLQEVYCYTNNLTSLNVNNDSVLRILDCSSNQLDQLNLNSNVALENLNCNINNLTSIDLSNNTALTNLSLNKNQLTSLNLINNEALVEIACDNNKLNTLDVTFNIALEKLSCNDNLLASLDVSRNRGLRYLSIYGNAFTTLNYNDVMCSMPFLGNETGTFYPLYDKNDNNYSEFIATNSTLAKNKNWTVNYADKNVTIPNTTDENYVCPANMNRYTIFDVPQGGQINFMVKGEVPNTAVMIVGVNINGKNDTTIIVDTAWTNVLNFTTLSDMVVVYGNVVGMHCEQNAENILGVSVTNDVLTYLNCSDDSLYTLNVDKAPMLTYLYCANNNLSTLNVNNNPALIELDCHNNVITNLNVDENAQLTLLNCSFNNLDSLDVSPTPLLENLNCANNNISNLLVKQNLKLHTLNCANNNLEELVVVPNVELHTLDCSNNNLQDLDITNNSRLTALNCSSNQLTSLDLSYNPSIVRVACFNNLFSTQAFDDLMCSMPIVSNGIGLFFPLNDTYDNNDSLFKEANAITAMAKNWDVAYYSAFDPIYTNGTYVCPANMNNFVTMNVKQNEPIAIDVMSNLAIAPIRVISGRYDTTIYISNNWSGIINYTSEDTIMTVYGDFIALNCANNADNIIAIDASNAQITELNCESNAISSLILPQNATLESLNCASNQLLNLNLNNSSALVELNCANNTLSDLDLSQNVALEVLDCSGNNLAILDVNNNIALNTLICYNNPFTTQTYDDLMCSMPFAVNNTGNFFPLYDINDVNDTIFNNANANTANIKNWNVAYFSTNDVISTIGVWICPVDTNNFITLNVTPNEPIAFDIHSQLTTAVKIVNGSFDTIVYIGNTWYGKTSYIADMNTITIYGNVESFDCANNTEILSINISNNTGLAYLDCSNSAQTSLDLSQNAALNVLNCANNNLSTLDINNNIALKELNCANNNLAGLTLSQNTALEVLNCTDNYLTTLDVAANNALNTLICYNNPFTTQAFDDLMCSMPTVVNNVGIFTPLFDDVDANYTQFMAANSSIALTKNWNVIYANATDVPATNGKFSCNLNMNQFITVDIAPNARINIGFTGNYFDAVVRVISGTTDTILFLDTTWTYLTFLSDDNAMIIYGDLEKFDCSNNGLSINAINVDNNTILTYLNCSSNNISNLNVANNTALNTLFTNSTQLSNLDVSKNLALTSLYCNNNNLTTLDVANNTQLEILACNNNALTSLDLSANTALNYLACYGNNFTSKDYDLLMCSMNQIDSVIGKFFPLRASSDPNYTQFMAANSNTAINKNWDVLYYSVNVNIPETRGKYDCFTGLDEVETEQITVYPNPANTTINITGVTAEHVDIYDITGRLILTVPTNGDEIVTINVSELAKGMYYIKIDNTTAKFVKQ